MNPSLASLLGPFCPAGQSAAAERVLISCLAPDSRQACPGALFFAIKGVHADGHAYAAGAIAAGASAIVHDGDLPADCLELARQHGCLLVRVEHSRSALSHAAAAWNGRPAELLTNIGVTGTDGKSSTTYFTHQLLQARGVASGFFSTVAMQTGAEVEANGLRQSTPEAPELHAVLAAMLASGKTYAVVETTSHGLSRQTARLRDVPFRVGVFTNLSHEHLEFHGSYEQYRSDKANLFRALAGSPDAPAFAVVNGGDVEAGYFQGECRVPVVLYGSTLCPPAREALERERLTLWADEVEGLPDHCRFRLHFRPDGVIFKQAAGSVEARIPLPGTFNVENVLAAMLAVAGLLGCSPLDLVADLRGLKSIKGRMLPINQGQDFSLIVDYAHTPGAYAKVLPVFRKATKGRLIAVFGSAGERDREKRPMQGSLAAAYCDHLVLTNEDPRLEDELLIIDQIAEGALAARPDLPVDRIPDRRAAIAHALGLARPGDCVVLLGKGHEQSIIYPDGKRPWDEETVARQILSGMGYSQP